MPLGAIMPLTKGPSGLLRRFNMSSLIFLDLDTSTQENTMSTELSTFFRKKTRKARRHGLGKRYAHDMYGVGAGDETAVRRMKPRFYSTQRAWCSSSRLGIFLLNWGWLTLDQTRQILASMHRRSTVIGLFAPRRGCVPMATTLSVFTRSLWVTRFWKSTPRHHAWRRIT